MTWRKVPKFLDYWNRCKIMLDVRCKIMLDVRNLESQNLSESQYTSLISDFYLVCSKNYLLNDVPAPFLATI